jgi:hypothetical protein
MDKHTPLTKITGNKEKQTPTRRKTIFKEKNRKYQEIQGSLNTNIEE